MTINESDVNCMALYTLVAVMMSFYYAFRINTW